MSDDLTNLQNPQNQRNDIEERNQPHVTPLPAQAEADDLFDDSVQADRPYGEPRRRPGMTREGCEKDPVE